jgi:hypothetical protein
MKQSAPDNECAECGRFHRTYRALAKCRWGKDANEIVGDGPFAVLLHCHPLTVTLCDSRESANDVKGEYCGGTCNKMHEIVDLGGK